MDTFSSKQIKHSTDNNNGRSAPSVDWTLNRGLESLDPDVHSPDSQAYLAKTTPSDAKADLVPGKYQSKIIGGQHFVGSDKQSGSGLI